MAQTAFTETDFINALKIDVSRETLEKLNIYESLLKKWQKTINLVSTSTLPNIWKRHFLDSAQLIHFFPKKAKTIIDFGSGGGFPVLVYAILLEGQKDNFHHEIHAIESDARKTAFMREVIRNCQLKVLVHTTRIEQMAAIQADIITARALAPMSELITYTRPFINPETVCLFLKGQNADDEIAKINRKLHADIEKFPSLSDSSGQIVKITNIREF